MGAVLNSESSLSAKMILKRIPFIRAALERRHERMLLNNFGFSRGVFNTFEEAAVSSPRNRPVGCNVAEYASVHLDRLNHLEAYDYPVLFWLRPLLHDHCTLFDLGGNVGVHYHAYRKYLDYPAGFRWIVCDLPEITKAGIAIANERDDANLLFTNSIEQLDGADILIAAGALQYIDQPIESLLSTLHSKPRHLLFNKLPLYDGPGFVTLQNGGPVFLPQYIFNKEQFLGSLRRLGYRVVDAWQVPGFSCYIPLHPDRTVHAYTGLYLQLAA